MKSTLPAPVLLIVVTCAMAQEKKPTENATPSMLSRLVG